MTSTQLLFRSSYLQKKSRFPQYFQKDLPELVESDPDHLFNLAFSMKINTKQMKKWEKEYAAVRKKEQEEMGELRVLPIIKF